MTLGTKTIIKRKFDDPDDSQGVNRTVEMLKQVEMMLTVLSDKLDAINERLDVIESKIPDKHVSMAQHKTLRECKVLLKKLCSSLDRMNGETTDELQAEVKGTISTIDACLDIE